MNGVDINSVVASVLNEYGAVCAELERARGYLRDKTSKIYKLETKLSDLNNRVRIVKKELDIMSDYSDRLGTILIEDYEYDEKILDGILDKSRRVYEEEEEKEEEEEEE